MSVDSNLESPKPTFAKMINPIYVRIPIAGTM